MEIPLRLYHYHGSSGSQVLFPLFLFLHNCPWTITGIFRNLFSAMGIPYITQKIISDWMIRHKFSQLYSRIPKITALSLISKVFQEAIKLISRENISSLAPSSPVCLSNWRRFVVLNQITRDAWRHPLSNIILGFIENEKIHFHFWIWHSHGAEFPELQFSEFLVIPENFVHMWSLCCVLLKARQQSQEYPHCHWCETGKRRKIRLCYISRLGDRTHHILFCDFKQARHSESERERFN